MIMHFPIDVIIPVVGYIPNNHSCRNAYYWGLVCGFLTKILFAL